MAKAASGTVTIARYTRKPSLVVPPIPEGLCGDGGCVFTEGHASRDGEPRHSWQR